MISVSWMRFFFEIRAEYYELSGDLHLRGEISKESDQCVINYLSN